MGDSLRAVLPLLFIALAFVLLFMAPARARARMAAKTREMQDSLTPGTEVMTTSGLYGTIREINDKTVDLEISPGIVVTFVRQAIAEVRTPDVEDADDAEATAASDAATTDSAEAELADATAKKDSASL